MRSPETSGSNHDLSAPNLRRLPEEHSGRASCEASMGVAMRAARAVLARRLESRRHLRLIPFLVVLFAIPLLGCQQTPCTLVPPPPNDAVTPAEWNGSVRSNCFIDLERLNRWYGQQQPLQPGQSPAGLFIPVGEDGITAGSVSVVVHGWAPGFRGAVDDAGGRLLWWSDGATNSDGIWSSDWAWVPSQGTAESLAISNGLFQELVASDPQGIVLGYSWIDDSATVDDSYTDLEYVYRSEAYTSINGVRLANALEQALADSFWSGAGNTLHLIGHSHGSKVATVATLTLQSRGRRVDHLTTLDSPESETTVAGNGSNLLGFYLDQVATSDGSGGGGTFVDNYLSYFAVGFEGTSNSDRVVDVVLDPEVYSCDDPGDRHSYSAEWYAGAAAAAKQYGLGSLGLDWPPPQTPNKPALNQTWSTGVDEKGQWPLTAGSFGYLGCESWAESCAYPTAATTVTTVEFAGNVSGSPSSELYFTADIGTGVVVSWFEGSTDYGSDQYGIAFDVTWKSPMDGDYLVVSGSDSLGNQEVLMVMDGRSAGTSTIPVAINAYVVDSLDFYVYYLPAPGNHAGQVTLSGFSSVSESCSDEAPVAGEPDA